MKKILSFLLYIFFVSLVTLLLLELCYRYYVVDFYKGSLVGLNSEADLKQENDQETILVFGDSFSADTSSYVKHLRRDRPQYRIINAAVAGTTVKQHALMAKSRIERFDPSIIIYQIYLGNDLFEYRHPTKGHALSWLRKIYWWLADRLLVIAYINAKLPQLKKMVKQQANKGIDAKWSTDYAPENYNQRVKMQFQIEPQLLEHTVLLQGKREVDFQAYQDDLTELLEAKPTDCEVILLLMPHCAQLGTPYLERMEELGAVFQQKAAFLSSDFPFLKALEDRFSAAEYTIVNALAYLDKKVDSPSLFYENDPHLTPQGQWEVATILKPLVD